MGYLIRLGFVVDSDGTAVELVAYLAGTTGRDA